MTSPGLQGSSVKALFRAVVNLFVAGLVFLLPVFVVLLVVTKAWTALSTFGTRVAGFFGVKHIIGLGSDTAFTGVLLILLCIACGWLVRFSLLNAFHDAIETQLIKYIPGYQTYKADTEDKLHKRARVLPYTSALVRHSGFRRPAYVIQQDAEGRSVIFARYSQHGSGPGALGDTRADSNRAVLVSQSTRRNAQAEGEGTID